MTSTPHFQGQSTLSELFTVVYILADDYLKASERAGIKLPQAANQKGSYAELMAIALVGELRSQTHVGNWFDFVKIEYVQLFSEITPPDTVLPRTQTARTGLCRLCTTLFW